jgi:hypothetical protein
MTARMRRWKSTSDESGGDEVISAPLLPGQLKAALRPPLQSGSAGEFLLVRLASSDHGGVSDAIRAIGELKAKVHIALAVDLDTLGRLDRNLPNVEGVGLVLDGVDAATPLSAFILDSVEAVRFEGAFTAAACRSLRIAAVLRAMLSLASDLALSTFASEAPASHLLRPCPVFDYVFREEATPLVIPAKTRPTVNTRLKAFRRGVS